MDKTGQIKISITGPKTKIASNDKQKNYFYCVFIGFIN